MQTKYIVLVYSVDLLFHDDNRAIEIVENNERNIVYEIKRRKAIQQKSGFKFIRINPDEKNGFKAMNEWNI